jgi:hypothetical protein
MSKQLNRKQFMEAKPPVFWVRISTSTWSDLHEKAVLEFLKQRCSGWWYRDGDTFCFGYKGDRVLFALWVKGNELAESYGQID